MAEKGIDALVAREGAMTAIVAENENSPHEESGKEPEDGEI